MEKGTSYVISIEGMLTRPVNAFSIKIGFIFYVYYHVIENASLNAIIYLLVTTRFLRGAIPMCKVILRFCIRLQSQQTLHRRMGFGLSDIKGWNWRTKQQGVAMTTAAASTSVVQEQKKY